VTTTGDSAYKDVDIPKQACDYLNGLSDVQKILVIDLYLENGVFDEGGDTPTYTIPWAKSLVADNPEIVFVGNFNYVIDGAPTNHSFFDLASLGYEYCPYVDYDRQDGKVVIQEGKIDDNIIVIAKAEKSDLLYISGYLASSATAQKYASKNSIKGVSLGYNHLNIEKNKSPKNMAFAMFTINDEVGDMATEAFEITVKNAESVNVYYKATPGSGTASKSATYNKAQDDEIRNLYAPEDTGNEKSAETIDSVFADKNNSGSALSKVGNVVLMVVKSILRLVLIVVYFGILAFIGFMVFNKKFRANVLSKLYSTKHGPKIQEKLSKVVSFINSLFFERKKIKAAANLNGKYIFISHASVDYNAPGSIITALIAELKKLGVDCWTSEDGIKTGEDYNEILPLAIDNCEMMLFFISPASINSTEVESEIIAAKRLRKKLIPIQISDFDLFANSKWQHILAQYQVTKLLTADASEISEMAKHIKTVFDK